MGKGLGKSLGKSLGKNLGWCGYRPHYLKSLHEYHYPI